MTLGRMAALGLLLLTMLGPWFIDTHPASAQTCTPPLVWLGNGYCACFVTFTAAFRMAFSPGHQLLWLLFLPIALPFLSTVLLLLRGERRRLWVFHLGAWGLVAVYALLMFFARWLTHPDLIIWGAGLGGLVAVSTLVGEILVGKPHVRKEST
jgi:hypothetical protein